MRFLVGLMLIGLFTALQGQRLNNTRWILVSIDDLETGISKDIINSAKATIHFDSDSIYSGRFCNSFCGKIKFFEDNAVKMIKPVSTRILCMGLDKYEKEMMAVFVNANKLRTEDDKLFIFSTNRKRLTYKRDRGH